MIQDQPSLWTSHGIVLAMHIDQCRLLVAPTLYRAGFLKPGRRTWEWDQPGSQRRSAEIVTEADAITLRYRLETGQEIEQRISVVTLPCKPTRGVRWFFECPFCGRRRWKLYSPPGCLFRCRDCYGLVYRTCSEGKLWRRLRRMAQVGVLLEGVPVDGAVPLSHRDRVRLRRTALRERLRDLLAIGFLELVRDDDADGGGLY
jgi:hypothetical protein